MDGRQLLKLIDAEDVRLVGGKAQALGVMCRAGFAVPNGFVVSARVFEKMTPTLEATIRNAFDALGAKFVAVRSSAIGEDSVDAAWAGQLDTFLNCTREDVVQKVEDCWKSAYGSRAASYARQKGVENTRVAVVVQAMIDSSVSGVAFSIHPVSGDASQIVIEAGLGLGEAVVSGQITPDTYVVDKNEERLPETHIGRQKIMLVRSNQGENIWKDTGSQGALQKLPAKQLVELCGLIKKLEVMFGHPVDVEWAIQNSMLYLLQCRPITTLSPK